MWAKTSKTSIERAAEHFGVDAQVIHRWIDNGILKAESIEGHPVVHLPDDDSPDERNGRSVTLWHGTTEDRAQAIIEQGFRTPNRKVWFTEERAFARQHARHRASARNETPVVISCEIDLEKSEKYQKRQPQIYVFFEPLGKEVVRSVYVVRKNGISQKVRHQSIDVAVTKTAGKLGVLWWMNRYLELEGMTPVGEDNPAVEAIHRWVEAEYAAGRDDPIADEEMLMQIITHLKSEAL